MCNDGWLQGWHERNGGNLTYRMKEEEVAQCRLFFDPDVYKRQPLHQAVRLGEDVGHRRQHHR